MGGIDDVSDIYWPGNQSIIQVMIWQLKSIKAVESGHKSMSSTCILTAK
jgi:hypothetical protein